MFEGEWLNGRVAVSKTVGCVFESRLPCQNLCITIKIVLYRFFLLFFDSVKEIFTQCHQNATKNATKVSQWWHFYINKIVFALWNKILHMIFYCLKKHTITKANLILMWTQKFIQKTKREETELLCKKKAAWKSSLFSHINKDFNP